MIRSPSEENIQLLDEITRAIRTNPKLFAAGGEYLDTWYSTQAFRKRRAIRLLKHRLERRIAIAEQQSVIGLLSEAEHGIPSSVACNIDGLPNAVQFDPVLDVLVASGGAEWRVIPDGHEPAKRCFMVDITICRATRPPRYHAFALDELHDDCWKRVNKSKTPSNPAGERLTVALKELSEEVWPYSPDVAQALCVAAWLVSDPKADDVDLVLAEFQTLPWSSGSDILSCRHLVSMSDSGDGPHGLFVAARRAVAHLKATGKWPTADEGPETAGLESGRRMKRSGKRTGRRRIYDECTDKRLVNDLETSGLNAAEFAQEKGISVSEVRQAKDRVRKRTASKR